MSSSLKYLLLVAPAALMIAILFLYPLGFSLVSAFTAPGQPFTLDHFRKVYALYASDVLFSLIIVLVSVALLALIAITLSAVIALSPCRPVVRLLGFLYRLPLFIPFIVVAQMMRTFLAKNGLMNNALVAADLVTPLETRSWLGWKGIVITFVWKQLAFATLLTGQTRADIEEIFRTAVESVEGVACDLDPEFMGDRRKMEQAVRTSGDCRMYQDRVLKAFHGHDIARTHIVHLCELYGLLSGLCRIV